MSLQRKKLTEAIDNVDVEAINVEPRFDFDTLAVDLLELVDADAEEGDL